MRQILVAVGLSLLASTSSEARLTAEKVLARQRRETAIQQRNAAYEREMIEAAVRRDLDRRVGQAVKDRAVPLAREAQRLAPQAVWPEPVLLGKSRYDDDVPGYEVKLQIRDGKPWVEVKSWLGGNSRYRGDVHVDRVKVSRLKRAERLGRQIRKVMEARDPQRGWTPPDAGFRGVLGNLQWKP